MSYFIHEIWVYTRLEDKHTIFYSIVKFYRQTTTDQQNMNYMLTYIHNNQPENTIYIILLRDTWIVFKMVQF